MRLMLLEWCQSNIYKQHDAGAPEELFTAPFQSSLERPLEKNPLQTTMIQGCANRASP